MWRAWFIVSLAVLFAGFLLALRFSRRYKSERVITPLHVIFASVALAVFFALLPLYSVEMEAPNGVWETILFSLHHTFQVFTLDADRAIVLENIPRDLGALSMLYPAYLTLLITAGPLLTFGFLLSFFRNVSAYGRYIRHYFKDVYIFSELNERSLALASDLRRKHRDALLVFTDVFDRDDERVYELTRSARELHALCFKRDIVALNFHRHSQRANLYFFAIGMDESENIRQSLGLIKSYGKRPNSHLYAFSSRVEAELLLSKTEGLEMKVRRIDDVRSIIYHLLYNEGVRLFDTATRPGIAGSRTISAIIVGLGQHGTEMLKALTWFCQMDGYSLKIDAFDRDPSAADRFEAKCPELMSKEHNGVRQVGDAQYDITLHSSADVTTKEFADEIQSLRDTTYVLISLGSDELNIRTAVDLRMLFERIGAKPIIQAIVYDPDMKEALEGVTNFKGVSYDIELVGDLKSSYTEDVIIQSRMEQEALAGHLKWGKEQDFWQYTYNYRSSLASAIHRKAWHALRDRGALTIDDQGLKVMEHRRWNAYMRAEGYVYAKKRNDLAKTHHDLVPFKDLTREEIKKDEDIVNT